MYSFFVHKPSYKSKTPTKDVRAPGEVSRPTDSSLSLNFLNFFLFGGKILAFLDPDLLTQLNPDPDSKNTGTNSFRQLF
jgi:hypothetical protein